MYKPNFIPVVCCLVCLFVAGCSKQREHSLVEQKQKPKPLEQPPLQPSPFADSSHPSDNDLQQAAESLQVTKEQAFPLLQREKVLWNTFQSTLHSQDHASDVVPLLVKTAKSITGKEVIDAHVEGQINGKQLPTSFLEILGYGSSSLPGISSVPSNNASAFSPGFMGVDLDKQPEQHVLNASVTELAKYRPDLLASFASKQASILPPTAADYIIFQSALDGFAESPFLEQAATVSLEPKTIPHGGELMKLSKAPNPIYRLLALRVAKDSEPDKTRLIRFYSSYSRETDPTIRTSAINALKVVGGVEASKALQDFGN